MDKTAIQAGRPPRTLEAAIQDRAPAPAISLNGAAMTQRAPKPAWKRVLMILAAVPLAVLGNVVRITGVIIAGDAFGHDAGAFVEQKLGFVTFAVAIACVLSLGYVLRDEKSDRRVLTEQAV